MKIKELDGVIKINCKLVGRKIIIEVIDSGCGIENIEEARKMLFTSLVTKERSGMGFTIMENFMDKVNIESIVGVGTKVVMEKELKKEIDT